MDEIVARAMQKWPNVPEVFGWLRLDRRGSFWLKSASSNSKGPENGAATGAVAGAPGFERIGNPAIVEFIGRNYAHDDRGRWFFQNGPQRVFVLLDYTPLVYRLEGGLIAHTGAPARRVEGAWLDEHGALLFATELGPGVLVDRDLAAVADAFADPRGHAVDGDLIAQAARGTLTLVLGGSVLAVGNVQAGEVPSRFGFDPTPAPAPGRPDC